MSIEKNQRVLWQDGRILSPEEAQISVLSPTCMYGLNVFETIRGYRTHNDKFVLFRALDHLERLLQSCRILDIDYRGTVDEILEATKETVAACHFENDFSVRIVLYFDSEGGWSTTSEAKLLVAPIAKSRTYDAAISCCISSWERIRDNSAPPRAKVGANYVSGRLAQAEARRHGYDTPLLMNSRGTVSEAPGACLFAVRDQVLLTPPSHASILESITRDSVIEMAHDLGIQVRVREIDRTELYCAGEAFICGTAVEITPIQKIDHCVLEVGENAPITESLIARYFEIVRAETDARNDWLLVL